MLFIGNAASATSGRDFAATYKLANITESGDVVHVTVTLNLRNNGNATITNGSAVLFSSEANPSLLGSFDMIQVLSGHQSVTQSQTFSISKAEYQLWQEGRDPSIRFVVEDANGTLLTKVIDLQRVTPGVGGQK
jgi:hypothetical protein